MRILLFALFISQVASAEECAFYELRGKVVTQKTDMNFVIAEKSQSQKIMTIALETQLKLSPYINRYVKIEAITRGEVIQSVLNVQDEIPNPLNRNLNTELKKIKDIKCL